MYSYQTLSNAVFKELMFSFEMFLFQFLCTIFHISVHHGESIGVFFHEDVRCYFDICMQYKILILGELQKIQQLINIILMSA